MSKLSKTDTENKLDTIRRKLSRAVGCGDLVDVKQIVSQLASNDFATREEVDSIIARVASEAVKNGNLDMIKYFVDLGVDQDVTYVDSNFAISHAVRNGHTEIVDYFVQRVDGRLWAIRCAAKQNEIAMLKHLCKNGIDNEILESQFKSAARWGHLDTVKYFQNMMGQNLSKKECDGLISQAIQIAVDNSRYDVANYLSKGDTKYYFHKQVMLGDLADVKNIMNEINLTEDIIKKAVLDAAKNGNLEMVELLIKKWRQITPLDQKN